MNREELIQEIMNNGLENTYKKELSARTKFELESIYYKFISPDEDPHYSYSQLNMYQRCGLQFFYRYVMGLKIPPDGGLVRGKALHETWAIEGQEKMKTGEQLSIQDKRELYHGHFEAEAENAEFGEESKEEILSAGEAVIPVHHYATKKEIPIAIEEAYEREIDGKKVIGFIDKITMEGVIDLKVKGKKMSVQDQYGLQLPTYVWFSGINEVGYDVFTTTKKPEYQAIRRVVDDNEVNRAVKKMKLMIDGIEKKVFIPCETSSWLCSKQWCGYYEMCQEEVLDA